MGSGLTPMSSVNPVSYLTGASRALGPWYIPYRSGARQTLHPHLGCLAPRRLTVFHPPSGGPTCAPHPDIQQNFYLSNRIKRGKKMTHRDPTLHSVTHGERGAAWSESNIWHKNTDLKRLTLEQEVPKVGQVQGEAPCSKP
ncbi:hypothetical protein GDO78_004748 [Eleutherodactylus coqui]|uniref:Uncharacterized protein n=1 Tax=Eleutherodactylus coqui TaxID=57060 RepID=A0A8J6ETD5_ELECQ|nr:hypothetical protein GDO78_004748 [Eleutherodactylus coqui]